MSYVSRHELRKAYEDCIKRKRGTENAIKFEVDDNEKLENLYVELNTLKYKIGKSIVFVLNDFNGNPKREVFAADFKDRIVHHLLINRILPKIEENALIDDNYACRKNKGVLYGVKRCQEKLIEASNNGTKDELYIFKGDFKNCFNSLNKTKIYNILENFIIKYFPDDRNAIFNLWLLKMILMHCPQKENNYIRKQPKIFWEGLPKEKSMFNLDDNHGIAVGNLSSQVFANFFLGLFDNYITKVLGYKFYGRYVDDFYIIIENKKKFLDDYVKIKEFAELYLDMKISETKFYLQHYTKGVKFIGYVVRWNRIYISKRTKSKFFKTLHEMWTVVKERFVKNNVHISYVSAQKIMATWNSYIGILNNINGRNIILDAFNKNQKLIKEMSYVFIFDRFGYAHMAKHMKLVWKNLNMGGKNLTKINSEYIEKIIKNNMYLKENREH